MIVLSKAQLKFLRDIKNKEVTDVESFIKKYCKLKKINLRDNSSFLNYTFSKGEEAFILEERETSAELIFDFVDLCLKLEQEKLIISVLTTPNKITPLFEENKLLGEHSPERIYFPDESVLALIHLFNKKIYPTSEIAKLKNRVFKNRKDKYYNRSLIIAWASFGLALIVGLTNIFDLFSTKKNELTNNISKKDTIFVKITPTDSATLDNVIGKVQNESKTNKNNNHTRTTIK